VPTVWQPRSDASERQDRVSSHPHGVRGTRGLPAALNASNRKPRDVNVPVKRGSGGGVGEQFLQVGVRGG